MTVTREDLLSLALDVAGLTPAQWNLLMETLKVDAAMNLVMSEDWHRKPRDSEEAIRDYYRESGIWFANTWSHGVGALIELSKPACPRPLSPWQEVLSQQITAGPILDYGGGLFKDTWPFAAAGHRLVVAEVDGPVTEFLKRYITLAGLENRLGVVEVASETPLRETYGGIACFETLEHVLRPVELAGHLHDHLRPGGPFAFSVSFGGPSHAPYHVASNAPLGDERVWASKLDEIGFRPFWKDEVGCHLQIWRRP